MGVAGTSHPRGSIVLVRLPQDKARPSVVVRSSLLDNLNYITLLPITTKRHHDLTLRIDVEPTSDNGLMLPSQIMVDWPQTVRLSRIGDRIGMLDEVTLRLVTRQLAIVFGIGLSSAGPIGLGAPLG